MVKKIKIMILAVTLLIAIGGLQGASALIELDDSYPGQQFIVPIIAPEDNYLYIQNNDVEITEPAIRVFSLFAIHSDQSLDQLWDGVLWQPSGTASIAFELIPQEYPVQKPGGVMYFGENEGLSLRDNINGIVYLLIGFIDNRPHAVHKIDYTSCIETAKGDLSGVECRASLQEGEIIYEAYRDNKKIVIEKPTNELPVNESEENSAAKGALIDDSKRTATFPASGTPTSPKTVSNDISSNENVKNTNSDTNSAVVGATSMDHPSAPSQGGTSGFEAPVGRVMQGSVTYHWWALLPLAAILLTVCLTCFIGFVRKRYPFSKKTASRLRL